MRASAVGATAQRAMITRIDAVRQIPGWQTALQQAISDPAELLQVLRLDDQWLDAARRAARLFPLRAPRDYVARMRPGDAHDPLLRQVLPLGAEWDQTPGYAHDPVGDLDAMAAPGVLHKYHGRVLLVTTGACAIHCRYCFRRHFPYTTANPAAGQWRGALDYIESDSSIGEVILSGGDPLSLTDARLAALAEQLNTIAHLKRLRVHTRLPVVIPERITSDLLAWLSGGRLQAVMVIHANHAQELDDRVAAALARLRDAGVTLLNQSVLLRGVNDSVEVLAALSERLFALGVLPYYLHLLDRVQGAAHFDVPESEAAALMSGLNACLPGFLVPKLVREIFGASGKSLISY